MPYSGHFGRYSRYYNIKTVLDMDNRHRDPGASLLSQSLVGQGAPERMGFSLQDITLIKPKKQ